MKTQLQQESFFKDFQIVFKFVLFSEHVNSLGTDRNGLLAAGPDLAGYQFTIRLAGFCRTKTGVWRVKYKIVFTV